MALSRAYLCTREIASDEFERLKKQGLLNPNLKPMPYGEMIAIPVIEGEIELDFDIVQKTNPHDKLDYGGGINTGKGGLLGPGAHEGPAQSVKGASDHPLLSLRPFAT